uniref:Cysteine-rich motor neuron 1 protein-like n=1 Tax=Saccoglossus kowalevskii TaxID=10224 RepID=A0ABM0LWS0_SACKO|nr:PREDICTED: cysteine-rich motor neuron 1 protein-like [Saccoglossus kowalevskii]
MPELDFKQLAIPEHNFPDCSKAKCEPVLMPPCPEDSTLLVGFSPPGECCPEPPECVCDPTTCTEIMCADNYERVLVKESTGEPGSCCDVVECRQIVTGGISGDGCCLLPERCECVNTKCERPVCETGFEPRQIVGGTGMPGSCCDVYECVNKTTRVRCLYEDQIYEDGANWLSDCHYCQCRGGVSHCQLQKDCHSDKTEPTPASDPLCFDQAFYLHSETWNRNDCTSCRCNHGEVQCTATSCSVSCLNPVKIPGQCCPYCEEFKCRDMRECDKHCPGGFKTGRNGCPVCRCKHIKECAPVDCGNKHCTYGFQKNKHGCNKCKCEKCPQFECDKLCTFGFVTNDNGCKLCKCKVAPTTPPAAVIPSGSCLTVFGDSHDNGESWHDGCRSCYCHNGQEMCSLISCPIPECQNPVLKSECCPTCPDHESSGQPMFSLKVCHSSDGQYYVEGETWYLDSCTQCVCHDGHVLCSPLSCPPVPCDTPIMKQDTCCPYCQESDMTTEDTIPPLSCTTITSIEYLDGDSWKEDDCTSCTCRHGEITCYSHVCPILECKTPILKKGQCCPSCLDPPTQKYCEFENQIYTEGERWDIDSCIHCYCQDAIGVCTIPECPELTCEDAYFPVGQCCLRCAEKNTYSTYVPPTSSIPIGERTSTTDHIISTSMTRSIFKIHPSQPRTNGHQYPTSTDLIQTTEVEDNEHASITHSVPILQVVLPIVIVLIVFVAVLLIFVVMYRRYRQKKSSNWHKSTKHLEIKNSNAFYNGATRKAGNDYVDPSKLNFHSESTRDSGMFSMKNSKNTQNV